MSVPRPTALTRPRDHTEQRLKERVTLGMDLLERLNSDSDKRTPFVELEKWRDYNLELIKRLFTDRSLYSEYDVSTHGSYLGTLDAGIIIAQLPVITESVAQQITTIESIIHRLELMDEALAGGTGSSPSPDGSKIFVVHGRDNEAKVEVARFLERIGLEAIILHERPNLGRHLLTKFQEEAEGVGFAVVLITPDDDGALIGEPLRKRARQNVVSELGFLIGKLGPSRVACLSQGRSREAIGF